MKLTIAVTFCGSRPPLFTLQLTVVAVADWLAAGVAAGAAACGAGAFDVAVPEDVASAGAEADASAGAEAADEGVDGLELAVGLGVGLGVGLAAGRAAVVSLAVATLTSLVPAAFVLVALAPNASSVPGSVAAAFDRMACEPRLVRPWAAGPDA